MAARAKSAIFLTTDERHLASVVSIQHSYFVSARSGSSTRLPSLSSRSKTNLGPQATKSESSGRAFTSA